MRKILTFVAAMCCSMFLSVKAADLADGAVITIGSTAVTTDNMNDVKDAEITAGKISYNSTTHTLLLEDVDMTGDAGIVIDASATGADFTIQVSGENEIFNYNNMTLHFKKAATGRGLIIEPAKEGAKLSLKSWQYGALVCREDYSNDDAATFYPLTIKHGVEMKVDNDGGDSKYAISCHHYQFDRIAITISGYNNDLIEFKEAGLNKMTNMFLSSTSYHTQSYDFFMEQYPIWIAGEQLDDKHKSYTGSALSSGTISYNPEERLLTLSNIKFLSTASTGIIINDAVDKTTPVTVLFEGTSGQLAASGSGHACLFETPVIIKSEGGSLFSYTINAQEAAIVHSSTLTFTGGGATIKIEATKTGATGIYGMVATAKLIVDQQNVWVKGNGACISEYGKQHEEKGVIFSEPAGAKWDAGTESPTDGSDNVIKDTWLKFKQNEFTFTAKADPEEAGTIALKADGSPVSNPYIYENDGSSVELEMTANATGAYTFAYWDEDASNTTNPWSISISNWNESKVAHFRYNVVTTDRIFAITAYTKDVVLENVSLTDGSSIATFPATKELYGVTYSNGDVYWLEGLGSAALYTATFDPDAITKFGTPSEVIAASADYSGHVGLAYNEMSGDVFMVAYYNSEARYQLVRVNGNAWEKVMNLPEDVSVRAFACDASGDIYGIVEYDYIPYLVRFDLSAKKLIQIGKVSVSGSSMAMTYESSLAQFIVFNSNMNEDLYVLDPATAKCKWLGTQSAASSAIGAFAIGTPKPKHKITVKVADGQNAMGTVTPAITEKEYPEGAKLNITATPKKGYLFDKWSDDGEQTHQITVGTADAVYTASFKQDPENIPTPVTVNDVQLMTKDLPIVAPNATYGITTGSIDFDPSTNVLTLNSVTLSTYGDVAVAVVGEAENQVPAVTVNLYGTNSIEAAGCALGFNYCQGITITAADETANLKLKSVNAMVINNSKVTFEGVPAVLEGGDYGILGKGTKAILEVTGSKLQVKGTNEGSIVGITSLIAKYCSMPAAYEYDQEEKCVKKGSSVAKDNIVFTPWPMMTATAVEDGSATFTLKAGSTTFTNKGWFEDGTDVTITCKPATGYVFGHWLDDGNYNDPENMEGATRTVTSTSSDKTYTAIAYYKAKSTANWYGINVDQDDSKAKFTKFKMSNQCKADIVRADNDADHDATKINAGDFYSTRWSYLEGSTVKGLPFSGSINAGEALTGETTDLANSAPAMTDMAYDFKYGTLYGVKGVELYTLNTETNTMDLVGEFLYKETKTAILAISIDGNGKKYVMAAGTPGHLYIIKKIDTDKGEVILEQVGPEEKAGAMDVNVDGSSQQSIAFDHATGELFWGAKDYMRLISTTDATTHIVGDLGNTNGNQGVVKAMHRMDKKVTVRVEIQESQESWGTAWVGNNTSAMSQSIIAGTKTTITAKANTGYHFVKWARGSVDSETTFTDNPYTVSTSSSVTFYAIFAVGEGIEEVTIDPTLDVQKIMVDGQIYILRDGMIYTITGALVK